MALGMSAASGRDSGLASGLLMTTQQPGGALALAVLASLSTSQTNGLLAAATVLRPAEEVREDSVPERSRPLGDVARPGGLVR